MKNIFLVYVIFSLSLISSFELNYYANAQTTESMKGHVKTITQYYLSDFQKGCHALISVDASPIKSVNVITTDLGVCNTLGNALVTGNFILFKGDKIDNPPAPPAGGIWSNPVYSIKIITLFNKTTVP